MHAPNITSFMTSFSWLHPYITIVKDTTSYKVYIQVTHILLMISAIHRFQIHMTNYYYIVYGSTFPPTGSYWPLLSKYIRSNLYTIFLLRIIHPLMLLYSTKEDWLLHQPLIQEVMHLFPKCPLALFFMTRNCEDDSILSLVAKILQPPPYSAS